MAAHIFPRRTTSTATTVTVTGTWTPPYTLPNAGQAVVIGTSTGAGVAEGIRPSQLTPYQWKYSLMGSYGGGCFVEDFSQAGGYALCGTGGHTSPPNFGAAVFDFADALWKRTDNANGMPWRGSGGNNGDIQSATEIDPATDNSILISGVTPGTMPPPPHTYMHTLQQRTSQGGGTKGSVLHVIGTNACSPSGNTAFYRTYRFDLNTGLWSRYSTNRLTDVVTLNGFYPEGPSVHDTVGNRYFQMNGFPWNTSASGYLDAADWTWKANPACPFNGLSGSGDQFSACFDPVRNWILQFGNNPRIMRVDLSNIGDGFRQLNVNFSVSMPTSNRWEYYPIDGKFYTYTGTSGNTIHRLTPPASSPLTNQWLLDSFTVGGDSLPTRETGFNEKHYTRFFYVPILQCFAWISTTTDRVVLVKP